MFHKIYTTIFCSIIAFLSPIAAAELMIAPTRILMEKESKSAKLVLVNKSNEQGAYRISLENRRMALNGSLDIVEEKIDGEKYATDILRYSPRRVMLEAQGRQTIRVSANTNGLEPGEYRSHLRIMGAPTSAGRTLTDATSADGDDISIELIAIRSLTIPVIVRVGELSADVEIESARTTPSEEADETIFITRLTRSGTQSVYGDLHLYVEGQSAPIYFARGIAIYTPNTARDVHLSMPTELANSLQGQNVRIAFVSSDIANPEVYSEITTFVN